MPRVGGLWGAPVWSAAAPSQLLGNVVQKELRDPLEKGIFHDNLFIQAKQREKKDLEWQRSLGTENIEAFERGYLVLLCSKLCHLE